MPTVIAHMQYSSISHFYIIGKKKYYLTANVFYGGVHFAIRSKIVNNAKAELLEHVCKISKITDTPIEVEIVYHSSKKKFDVDNKCYFWAKTFIDLIKTRGIIPDDNVQFVSCITMRYEYIKGDDMLEISILKR